MSPSQTAHLGIEDILGDKREAILRLAARHGASQVRVFGSAARGEAGPESDIDFLVTFPDSTSIFDVVELWLDLQDLIGREVDLLVDHPSAGRITQIAREEAVPL
jgi:hypothetical protein